MRRVFMCAGAVLMAALSASPLAQPTPAGAQVTGPRGTVTGEPARAGTAVLRGTVVASDSGAPVRRALVRATSSDPADNAVASTDDQGRFELQHLVGGRYTLFASKAGYVPVTYGQRRPNERGTPVEIAPGAVVEKITIGLPRGGVITGRIVDESGEPLADARVQVLRSQFLPGGRRMMPTGRSDSTDDQGSFRIHALPPGDYVVSATARGEMMVVTPPNGSPAPSPDQGYAPTYFPGTPSVSDAQRITVAVGQEVSGITFGMVPTRVARIRGRVVGGTRADTENAFVMVMPDDGTSMGAMNGGGMVQADGTFTMNGIAPGRYLLRVQPRGRPDEALVGVTSLTVAGADVDNVVIAMRKPGEVSGRIEFEGGAPVGVAPSQLRVQAVPLEPTRTFMTGPPRTNDDFTFSIHGATGPTLFRAMGAPGWYVKLIEAGGSDITDTPVNLALGADLKDVRVVMTRTAAALSGSVRDDRGNAVLDATVVIFPDDDTKWTFSSRFIRSARPGTDGRFEMRGLPAAGAYRLIALQGIEDMQIYDPEFLSTLRDRAERLSLAEGEAKAVDLRLRQ